MPGDQKPFTMDDWRRMNPDRRNESDDDIREAHKKNDGRDTPAPPEPKKH